MSDSKASREVWASNGFAAVLAGHDERKFPISWPFSEVTKIRLVIDDPVLADKVDVVSVVLLEERALYRGFIPGCLFSRVSNPIYSSVDTTGKVVNVWLSNKTGDSLDIRPGALEIRGVLTEESERAERVSGERRAPFSADAEALRAIRNRLATYNGEVNLLVLLSEVCKLATLDAEDAAVLRQNVAARRKHQGFATPQASQEDDPISPMLSSLRRLSAMGHAGNCLSISADGGPCDCGHTETERILRELERRKAVEGPHVENRDRCAGPPLVGEDTRCARCAGSVVPGSMLCRACLNL